MITVEATDHCPGPGMLWTTRRRYVEVYRGEGVIDLEKLENLSRNAHRIIPVEVLTEDGDDCDAVYLQALIQAAPALMSELRAAKAVVETARTFRTIWLDNGPALWASEALAEARKQMFDGLVAYDKATRSGEGEA